jgi:uncharacterized damage-inducible protein DinB
MTKRIVLLKALASTPADLARLLRPVDDQSLRWQPVQGEWSAAAVLIHLVQVEKAYRHRLQRIAHEDKPRVPSIDPEVDEMPEPATAADLLHDFESERTQTIAFLKALSPGDWQRPAIHETIGLITIRSQVLNLVEHDIEHTNQFVTVLQQWRKMRLETREWRLAEADSPISNLQSQISK